jgi:hypothetical protein
MNDPLDNRIAHSLRVKARVGSDPDAAFDRFQAQRGRRRRRAQAFTAAAVAVLVIGGVAAATRGNQHRSRVTAADHSSTTAPDEPQAGVPATDVAPSTTSTAPLTSVTTAPSGLVATGSTPRTTTHRTAAATSTTAAPNLNNDVVGITVVTEADDGKTFTLHRGREGILVRLSNDNVWTEPQASDARVLTRKSGSTNSDGSAEATFMAAGDGQTTVSADGRSHPLPCETAQPRCMVPDHVVYFHVNVNVVG